MFRYASESTVPVRRKPRSAPEPRPEPEIPSCTDYLMSCSVAGLESFELSRLNRLANLRKEAGQILEEFVENQVQARIARCLLDCRRGPAVRAGSRSPDDAPAALPAPAAAAAPPAISASAAAPPPPPPPRRPGPIAAVAAQQVYPERSRRAAPAPPPHPARAGLSPRAPVPADSASSLRSLEDALSARCSVLGIPSAAARSGLPLL